MAENISSKTPLGICQIYLIGWEHLFSEALLANIMSTDRGPWGMSWAWDAAQNFVHRIGLAWGIGYDVRRR